MLVVPLTKSLAVQRLPELIVLDEQARRRLGTAYSHEDWHELQFLVELPDKWELSLAAIEGENICGFAIVSRKDQVLHIHRFAVAEKQQHIGVGRRMLDRLIEAGRQRNAAAIGLSVAADNRAAIQFYERFAFQVVARIEVSGHVYFKMKRDLKTQGTETLA